MGKKTDMTKIMHCQQPNIPEAPKQANPESKLDHAKNTGTYNKSLRVLLPWVDSPNEQHMSQAGLNQPPDTGQK